MRIAKIREEDCVGCAKCLPACPVDAIIGAPKFMHSIITEECIGCSLCVAPCPMDCIEVIELPDEIDELRRKRAATAKYRYSERVKRKLREQPVQLIHTIADPEFKKQIRNEIREAFERVKNKQKREYEKNEKRNSS